MLPDLHTTPWRCTIPVSSREIELNRSGLGDTSYQWWQGRNAILKMGIKMKLYMLNGEIARSPLSFLFLELIKRKEIAGTNCWDWWSRRGLKKKIPWKNFNQPIFSVENWKKKKNVFMRSKSSVALPFSPLVFQNTGNQVYIRATLLRLLSKNQ